MDASRWKIHSSGDNMKDKSFSNSLLVFMSRIELPDLGEIMSECGLRETAWRTLQGDKAITCCETGKLCQPSTL